MTGRADKFAPSVVREIGRKAMYFCANPECLRLTGYENDNGRPRAIADAAHISPASAEGPKRPDNAAVLKKASFDPTAASNGIWLCKLCHSLIDSNVSAYPAALLLEWRDQHATRLRNLMGKDLEACLLTLDRERKYHKQAHRLLVDLSDRRLLYDDIMDEFPGEVADSMHILRHQVTKLQGQVAVDTSMATTLDTLAQAIKTFLGEAGRHLDTVTVTSGDPRFERFRTALQEFRITVADAVRPLAEEQGHHYEWIDNAVRR